MSIKQQLVRILLRGMKEVYMDRIISDKLYLSLLYRRVLDKKMHWDNPCTFNEKLQWLKIYNRRNEYTQMVDKIAVKKIVAEKLGEKYIIPTLGVWDDFDDIDFSILPDRFVLKCNHDSGSICICKNKNTFDIAEARKKMRKGLKQNLYWAGREWPYKDVKPRILAEKFMEDEGGDGDLKDYKLMCFNGKVYCTFVCSERFEGSGLKVTFFDRDWKRLSFERHYPSSEKVIFKPVHYYEMIRLAEELSKNIPFVRSDFYEINGQLYFGELTFYPGSGLEAFTPPEWDRRLGELIKLPHIDPLLL